MTTDIRNSQFDYRRQGPRDESSDADEPRFELPHQAAPHAPAALHAGDHRPFRKQQSKGNGAKPRGAISGQIEKHKSKNARLGAVELNDDDEDLGTDLDIDIGRSPLRSEEPASRRGENRNTKSRDLAPKIDTRRQVAGQRLSKNTYNHQVQRQWPRYFARPLTLAPGRGKKSPSLSPEVARKAYGITARLGKNISYKNRNQTPRWFAPRSLRNPAKAESRLLKHLDNGFQRRNGSDIPPVSAHAISQALRSRAQTPLITSLRRS